MNLRSFFRSFTSIALLLYVTPGRADSQFGPASGVLSIGGKRGNITVLPPSALPTPTPTTPGGVMAGSAPSHQFQTGVSTGGSPLFAQPQANDTSFTQSGADAVQGTADTFFRNADYYAWQFGITTIGGAAAAATNSVGFAAALAQINVNGGGRLLLPCGSVYVAAPIDNQYAHTTVAGCGFAGLHDAGTPTYATRIVPTTNPLDANGNQTGVLRHRTPYGTGVSVNSGGGFENLMVDGNGVARRLLDVDTVRHCKETVYLYDGVGSEAAYFHSGVSGTDVPEAADIQWCDIDIEGRQIDGTAAQASSIVTLDGSSNANFSFNKIRVTGQYYNGNAINLKNTDNNHISALAGRVGGSGYETYAYGAGNSTGSLGGGLNVFDHLAAGNVYVQGTEVPGVTGCSQNKVFDADTSNGPINYTLGTGCIPWTQFSNSTYSNAYSNEISPIILENVGNVQANRRRAQALYPNTSLYIGNGSQSHVVLTDGSNDWVMRVAGGGNLDFSRVTGSGVPTFNNSPLPPANPLGSGLAQGSVAIQTAGTGYAVGDTITLAYPGAAFSTAPVLAVSTIGLGGAVTGFNVTVPGSTLSSPPSASGSFTQASTSGSGTGFVASGVLAPIVANLSFPSLGTGGTPTNGNLFLGAETPAPGLYGGENVFVGDRAGGRLTGAASANTAVGHDACGIFGTATPNGNFNTCTGNDAGRNISGGASANTLVGQNAGRVMAGSFTTILGASSGVGSVGNYNTLLGYNVGASMTTEGTDIIIGANMDLPTIGLSNYFALGINSRSLSIIGLLNPATAAMRFEGTTFQIAGVTTVAALPACNAASEGSRAGVKDAKVDSFHVILSGGGSLHVPGYCDGTNWIDE